MTQLGPARIRLTFVADCTYRMSIRTLFIRVNEEGTYRVEDGAIVFSRKNGTETRWPYTLEEKEMLTLQEAENESRTYRRTK